MRPFYECKTEAFMSREDENFSFPSHFHDDIELIYMLEGSYNVFLDNIEYVIKEGEILVVFPNQIHRYQGNHNEKHITYIFNPNTCRNYTNVLMTKKPISPVIRGLEKTHPLHGLLLLVHQLINDEEQKSYDICQGLITAILGFIIKMVDLQDKNENIGLNSVQRIIEYCANNYMQEISLDSLAYDTNISKFHISHIFKSKIGLSFNDYLGYLRVACAKDLLSSTDDNMTEIAFSSGFSSIRSFNRVFRVHEGMSPSEYRDSIARA